MDRLAWSGTVLTCLFVVLTNLTYFAAGSLFGVYCYVCDSRTSFDCFNPNFDTHAEVCQYGCETNTTTTNDVNSVIRSCGPWQSFFDVQCTYSTKDSVYITHCYCKHDYCNNKELTPGSGFVIKKCYQCDYYGKNKAGVDKNKCVTPGQDTPTVLCPYGHCKKLEYASEDYVGIGRMCASKVGEEALTCTTEGTEAITYTTCHCNQDLCNHGSVSHVRRWSVFIAMVLGFEGLFWTM